MIIVAELVDGGTGHAFGNAAWSQAIARAAPAQAVRVVGAADHAAALRADAALAALPNVSIGEIPIPETHRGKVNVVSWARFREEVRALRAALADVPREEPVLVVLAQACPTAVFAARLVARLDRRRLGVQMVLHGFLNAIEGWRSRLPWLRRFDLRGLMEAPPSRVRFLALEEAIRDELRRLIPALGERVDVLPLPANEAEIPLTTPVPLVHPIRIGLVGQTTAPKGIGPFLELARSLKARFGERVEFHVVGRRFPDTPREALAVLARPIPDCHMSRAEFIERIAPLHYVCLPLGAEYYRLSPSGALIDAITWLKPIVATDLPIVRTAFRDGGDIGAMVPDREAMERELASLIEAPDPARYARQVAALRQLREARRPPALAARYRAILEAGFADVLPAAALGPAPCALAEAAH
ncbi:MAG: hypothetical protein NZ523_10645 [Elioraea sp.]|nr:hypothetical protein [Elioraea sp.]